MASADNVSVLKLFSLESRTALVTGGTRGIGLSATIAFAEAGADILLVQVSTNPWHASIIAQLIFPSSAIARTRPFKNRLKLLADDVLYTLRTYLRQNQLKHWCPLS